jgi:hypothetical protein
MMYIGKIPVQKSEDLSYQILCAFYINTDIGFHIIFYFIL